MHPYFMLQVPVSVMGVLSEIGSLGTVKRKSDNTEVSRRDVTIVDKRWDYLQIGLNTLFNIFF